MMVLQKIIKGSIFYKFLYIQRITSINIKESLIFRHFYSVIKL